MPISRQPQSKISDCNASLEAELTSNTVPGGINQSKVARASFSELPNRNCLPMLRWIAR